jgi:HPt (histidine-containing phosphotransfer) domain-containing protein
MATVSKEAAEKMQAGVAALWMRKRGEIEGRVVILERAASANPLPDELRNEAHDVVHKLAGSLGMFGFPQGTLIAREMEVLLEDSNPDSSTLTALAQQLRELLFPASQAL